MKMMWSKVSFRIPSVLLGHKVTSRPHKEEEDLCKGSNRANMCRCIPRDVIYFCTRPTACLLKLLQSTLLGIREMEQDKMEDVNKTNTGNYLSVLHDLLVLSTITIKYVHSNLVFVGLSFGVHYAVWRRRKDKVLRDLSPYSLRILI